MKVASLFASLFIKTPRRTFILFPIIAAVFQLISLVRFGPYNVFALPIILLGFLQYKLCGIYIRKNGNGGPSPSKPPKLLVITGPYRYVRNPMYEGHMIFLAGLTLFLSSYVALALFIVQTFWLYRKAIDDEKSLIQRYGEAYLSYKRVVPRWIPSPRKPAIY